MKHLFVLTLRGTLHLETNMASGTLEDVQTGEEFSFGSAMDLLSLLEQIVRMATSESCL
jgi:hypothetical protein